MTRLTAFGKKMTKMKYILSLLCLAALTVGCSSDDDFFYDTDVDAGNIKLLQLRADHYMLVPDGKATLKFYADAYNILELPSYTPTTSGDKVEYIPSVKRDTSLIPPSQLPKGLVRLYDETGKEYPDMELRTDDPTPRTLRFYLKAGELKSNVMEVQIRPLPAEQYEELEIPVVFHILQQPAKAGVPTIEIDSATVYKHISRMNKVFSGAATTDPNGWNAHIRFVPAIYDNSGIKLDNPGIHVYDVPSSVTFEKDEDFRTYVMEHRGALLYDYRRFLNIWLINNQKGSSTIVSAPTVIDDTTHPIPGISAKALSSDFPTSPTEVGFFVSMSYFVNPMQTDDFFELSSVMGRYLGLLVTQLSTNEKFPNFFDHDTDYCPDTPYYLASLSVFKNTKKTDNDKDYFYFTSYNIMDGYSYKNSVSVDQVRRLRTVLDRCPSRWMYKSRFATTGKD